MALKLHQPLQRELVNAKGWWQLDDGIEVVSFWYQAKAWDKPRRVVGIRQHIVIREEAKGKQLSLFADDHLYKHYRYAAMITNLNLPAVEVWRCYRGRADCENRIKELKYDFGAQSFCMNNFWATEAALNFALLAFNLMSLFRQAVVRATVRKKGVHQPVQRTLNTLRHSLFAQAGYINKEGGKSVLKLAIAMQRREWFKGLWDQSRTFNLPITFSPVFSP